MQEILCLYVLFLLVSYNLHFKSTCCFKPSFLLTYYYGPFFLSLSLLSIIVFSLENIHPFFQNINNEIAVIDIINITNKLKYLGKSFRLFKSKPCKLRILVKRESGNIIVENIVNTLITSFVCSDMLLEKVSLVEFIVS